MLLYESPKINGKKYHPIPVISIHITALIHNRTRMMDINSEDLPGFSPDEKIGKSVDPIIDGRIKSI
jgi:hypothetical protein